MKTIEEVQKLIKSVTNIADYFSTPREKTPEECESAFRAFIHRRLEHCSSELEEHISNATVTGQIVSWKGGHFTLPVYEELMKALDQDWHRWSALIWEQIVRQMFDEHNTDRYLFYFATEVLLCKS